MVTFASTVDCGFNEYLKTAAIIIIAHPTCVTLDVRPVSQVWAHFHESYLWNPWRDVCHIGIAHKNHLQGVYVPFWGLWPLTYFLSPTRLSGERGGLGLPRMSVRLSMFRFRSRSRKTIGHFFHFAPAHSLGSVDVPFGVYELDLLKWPIISHK